MSGLFLTELSGYDKVTKPCDEYRSMAFTFSGDIAATDKTLGTVACPIIESSITRCSLVMYTLSF
jgi:hypothetical protein